MDRKELRERLLTAIESDRLNSGITIRRDEDESIEEIVANDATIHFESMGSYWNVLVQCGGQHVVLRVGYDVRLIDAGTAG